MEISSASQNATADLAEELLRQNLLVSLPFRISPSDQREIIEEVVRRGEDLKVWKGYLVRGLKDPARKNEAYNSRLNPDLPWVYEDTPIAGLLKKLVEPLASFMQVTRIKIFVQKPNHALIEHVDKLEYKYNLLFRDFFMTEQFHDSIREPLHDQQNCFALKIPLTEVPGDNGRSYFRFRGGRYYVRPGDNYYVMNESCLVHGADPVAHHRGVVFVDGKIDLKEFAKLPHRPVEVWDASGGISVRTQVHAPAHAPSRRPGSVEPTKGLRVQVFVSENFSSAEAVLRDIEILRHEYSDVPFEMLDRDQAQIHGFELGPNDTMAVMMWNEDEIIFRRVSPYSPPMSLSVFREAVKLGQKLDLKRWRLERDNLAAQRARSLEQV